jgi:hypothetical protein
LFLTLNEIKNTDHYDGIKHVANQGDPSDAGKIQKNGKPAIAVIPPMAKTYSPTP